MKNKSILLFWLFLFMTKITSAQDINATIRSKDTVSVDLRILDLRDKLTIRTLVFMNTNSIEIGNNQNGKEVSLQPNSVAKFGVGVNYKWFGLNVGVFSLPTKGSERNTQQIQYDIQANIYSRNFVFDAHWGHYIGVRPEKLNGFPALENVDVHTLFRPDIRFRSFGASAYYLFRAHKYSYRSAFVHNSRQIKSGGTFLIGATTSIFKAEGDSALIGWYADDYFSDKDAKIIKVQNYGISGGYAYMFVFRKYFYTTLSVTAGPMIRMQSVESDFFDKKDKKIGEAVSAQIRFAIGYNGEKFFAGFSTVIDNIAFPQSDNIKISHKVQNLKIYFGRRFSFGE